MAMRVERDVVGGAFSAEFLCVCLYEAGGCTFIAPRMILRSPVSMLTTLLWLPFLLFTSCCEIEFLAPTQFSIHTAESIELRLQVMLL
jgi:hypothetical protein